VYSRVTTMGQMQQLICSQPIVYNQLYRINTQDFYIMFLSSARIQWLKNTCIFHVYSPYVFPWSRNTDVYTNHLCPNFFCIKTLPRKSSFFTTLLPFGKTAEKFPLGCTVLSSSWQTLLFTFLVPYILVVK